MKSATKIVLSAVLVAVMAATGYLVWSNYFGPALNGRIKASVSAAASAKTASDKINAISNKAAAMPALWAGLSFDEEAETTRILDDFNSNRGYKVDVLRDPSAAKIQADLASTDTELKSALDTAKKAEAALSTTGYLPASRRAEFERAKTVATLATKKGAALAANLKELKYDIDIWGFLSITFKVNGLYMAEFDQVSTEMQAGNYGQAATEAQDIMNGVNESVTWLTHGKQELTNIGAYSKDSDRILAFISQAKTTAESFNNAAGAGVRGDTERMTAGREVAEKSFADLKKSATEQEVTADFKSWFLKMAERRLQKP